MDNDTENENIEFIAKKDFQMIKNEFHLKQIKVCATNFNVWGFKLFPNSFNFQKSGVLQNIYFRRNQKLSLFIHLDTL